MSTKKWSISENRCTEDSQTATSTFQLTFGSVETPGETINDLTSDDLTRLSEFLNNYLKSGPR